MARFALDEGPEVPNRKIKIRVTVPELKGEIVVIPCGPGEQEVRWLALSVSQRLSR